MKKVFVALLLFFASVCSFAASNSSPGLYYGQVPTAAQWNSYFAGKLDYTAGSINTVPYWDGSGNFLNAAIGGDCTSVANIFTCNATTAKLLSNAAGGLTAVTTINDTVSYTTGGVILNSQTAVGGSVWRVRAFGTFVAVSSATARNAQIVPFWGSTQLTAITPVVLASVAQTTNWEAEFVLTASSTTAVWTTGVIQNKLNYPAIVAGTSAYEKSDHATPASTTVTAGAQTIDLRFSMSVAVATDQWVIESVTIERLK